MQLAAAVQAFTEYLERVRRLSAATVRAYRSDLRDLTASAGDITIGDVDLDVHRSAVFAHEPRAGVSATTEQADFDVDDPRGGLGASRAHPQGYRVTSAAVVFVVGVGGAPVVGRAPVEAAEGLRTSGRRCVFGLAHNYPLSPPERSSMARRARPTLPVKPGVPTPWS